MYKLNHYKNLCNNYYNLRGGELKGDCCGCFGSNYSRCCNERLSMSDAYSASQSAKAAKAAKELAEQDQP